MTLLDHVIVALMGMWFFAVLLTIGMAVRDFCKALGRPRK
jgi:hypothetical protein